MREIAGRETPSIAASALTDRGPAKTSTDSSDNRSGLRPVSRSAVLARRNM